jgi:hypothetical protein
VIGRKNLVEYTDAELMSIVCSAAGDFTATVPPDSSAEPERNDVRGFLQLVAGGNYRPKE